MVLNCVYQYFVILKRGTILIILPAFTKVNVIIVIKKMNTCFFLKFFATSRSIRCRPEWNSLLGNAVSPDTTILDQTGRQTLLTLSLIEKAGLTFGRSHT